MMKDLIIMRGLPGTGKTHYLSGHFPAGHICSADKFYETPNGWVFDVTKLANAHAYCQHSCLGQVSAHAPLVCVDNTNSQLWEYQNYVALGQLHGYRVRIIELRPKDMPSLWRAMRRQIHDVPPATYGQMIARWEIDPGPKATSTNGYSSKIRSRWASA